MRKIIPGQIWIGNRSERNDFKQLHDLGIRAIVDLAFEELPATVPRELIYCRIPLTDDGNNSSGVIKQAIETVVSLHAKRIPTLVCCSVGMSRSPVITAVALAVENNTDPKDCLENFFHDCPTDISTTLWKQVIEVYESKL